MAVATAPVQTRTLTVVYPTSNDDPSHLCDIVDASVVDPSPLYSVFLVPNPLNVPSARVRATVTIRRFIAEVDEIARMSIGWEGLGKSWLEGRGDVESGDFWVREKRKGVLESDQLFQCAQGRELLWRLSDDEASLKCYLFSSPLPAYPSAIYTLPCRARPRSPVCLFPSRRRTSRERVIPGKLEIFFDAPSLDEIITSLVRATVHSQRAGWWMRPRTEWSVLRDAWVELRQERAAEKAREERATKAKGKEKELDRA